MDDLTPRTLDELLDVLNGAPDDENDGAQLAYAEQHGLPTAHGRIDYTSLPTFGGDAPRNDVGLGVWSWDATHALVGDSSDELRIVPLLALEDDA